MLFAVYLNFSLLNDRTHILLISQAVFLKYMFTVWQANLDCIKIDQREKWQIDHNLVEVFKSLSACSYCVYEFYLKDIPLYSTLYVHLLKIPMLRVKHVMSKLQTLQQLHFL